MSDLKADLNEFNNFYNMNDCASYSKIERPQNPFDKNFEINRKQSPDKASDRRKNSLSELDDRLQTDDPNQCSPVLIASLLNLCPVE